MRLFKLLFLLLLLATPLSAQEVEPATCRNSACTNTCHIAAIDCASRQDLDICDQQYGWCLDSCEYWCWRAN